MAFDTFAQTVEDSNRTETVQGFIQSYCLDCHSGDSAERGFDLEKIDLSDEQFSKARLKTDDWEKILRRVASRQMPPVDAERPTEAEYESAISNMSDVLGQYAARFPQAGSGGTVRRLTRYEYQNAIRDLLAVNIDATDYLPRDESSHGFDNITVDELSPTLLTRYVSAAQKISRVAMGTTANGPAGVTIRIPADRTQEKHVAGLPFGTRGGLQFEYLFPQTGEYEIALKLTRDRDEKVEGLNRTHDIDVLIDRERVHQFTVKPPDGEGNWENRDFTHSDSHLVTRLKVTAGPHNVGVTFPKTFSSLVENKRKPFDANYNRHRHPRMTPAIFQVSLVGPFDSQGPGDTPSRRRIFGKIAASESDGSDAPAGTRSQAALLLRQFARKAYRRPVNDEDLEVPLRFFDQTISDTSGSFDRAMETAIASVLVNPNFLFRLESSSPSTEGSMAYPVKDIELATRLSFFLWSSLPDDELLTLAESGRLSEEAVLAEQVERMLRDDRSRALVENFAGQWLYLRNLESVTPDLRLFPDFDDNLRQSFRQETEHLFADVLKQDRSVLSLIKSDFTFLNERLALHYDIPHVAGSHFRKVDLSGETHRGGILRHGSILMVTSYATRTSPTIRGNWILENILGTPAPPPPANVPNLKENTQLDAATIRERLAQHRADSACASCHDLMDPVGFSLENYDAVGRWRNFDDEFKVDSAGILPSGEQVSAVSDLEAVILSRPHMFVHTLAEKLLTYALGRSVEAYDQPAVRAIVADAESSEYRFSSIIKGVVQSTSFRMRSNP